MKIGIPKEIKDSEYRVGLSPEKIKLLIQNNHEIFVTKDCGIGIGFSNEQYHNVGAKILASNQETYNVSELIIKVKEPQLSELDYIRKDQIIFGFFHLAANKELTLKLLDKQAIIVAYETLEDNKGNLPILEPMSIIAGKVAIQSACFALQKNNFGNGVLIGGVNNIKPCNVLILGGGIVGQNAAKIANGMGANVSILDKSSVKINELKKTFSDSIKCELFSNKKLNQLLVHTDILIGAIHNAGKATDKILQKGNITKLKENSVFVDVAIDQGGCSETSRVTTVTDPVYKSYGVIHYCVANIPALVAKTSSLALHDVTFPYIKLLSENNIIDLIKTNISFSSAINIYKNKIVNYSVAESLNLPYTKFNL